MQGWALQSRIHSRACRRLPSTPSGVLISQGVDSFAMKALTDQKYTVRFWVLGTCAVLLSAGSAFTFLNYIGQGIVVGDLLGLRGREADVATAQRWAIFWLSASCACFVGSSVTATLASPVYPDAPRVAKFIARLVMSATLSLVLTVLIALASFSVIAASHRSVIH